MTTVTDLFVLTRRGLLMARQLGDPNEAEGVLNPAVVRGRDGQLYLFARLVAAGNYSRIGLARVEFDAAGEPVDVQRLGVALEPQEKYEHNPWTGGGVEDPRITFVQSLDRYIMTYTAFSGQGPRVALAESTDLRSWRRLGLAQFEPSFIDFANLHNKDAVLFPTLVSDPDGRPALAMIHRPVFPDSASGESQEWGDFEAGHRQAPRNSPRAPRPHPSVWMSYCHDYSDVTRLRFGQPRRVLSPRTSWERLKVGAGTPPILTRHGWLVLYHGVSGNPQRRRLRYSAGAMLLDAAQPHRVIYRTPHPTLSPGVEERTGIVPNVVFPTGLDQRIDIDQPDRCDVYFGMADDRIGLATLHIPTALPAALSLRQRRVAA